MRGLCNNFLTSKKNKMDNAELSAHSFAEYDRTCERLIEHFGKDRRVDHLRPDDFEDFRTSLANGCGAVTLKSKINRCRVVFKFASDQRLIDRPVDYGQGFARPSAKVLRKARNEAGARMLEAEEIRRILDAADPVIRAMALLGINCGLGNTDVANLPQSAIDFDGGWVTFPRRKTEIVRRIPLWPETGAALKKAIAERSDPTDPADDDLCFVTSRGNRYVRAQESQRTPGRYATINTVARRFEDLLKRLHIKGRRGLGFYTLRHVFETIAGESRDQVTVDAIMGHSDESMAARYRSGIEDDRLRAVVDHVRDWLFG